MGSILVEFHFFVQKQKSQMQDASTIPNNGGEGHAFAFDWISFSEQILEAFS